ncbi:MAG: translation initiation factor IF-2 subunit alpha [Candidatus Altiarchaeota archaeon]
MKAAGDFPEVGEFVIGTVKEIFKQGAFITLDEYGSKRGMLHLSEISLKWVRNIRDYVREGQKVVLMVLNVDDQKGHIDLSLRRVTESQKKAKLKDAKKFQRSEKLVGVLAAELKLDSNEVLTRISKEIGNDYDSMYGAFEAAAADNKVVDSWKIPEKWKKKLLELIQKNIKAPYVSINGYAELKTYKPNGIDTIRETLGRISGYKTDSTIEVSYTSAPLYSVKVRAKEYKTAEKVLEKAIEDGIGYMEKNGGEGVFHRSLPSK